jgi:uncharacterized protein (DUF58 family)
MMREMDNGPIVWRLEAEARLGAARADGNHYAEAAALADLVEITSEQGDVYGLVTYAERAWEAAESNSYWDQLARLARVFGDIAYHVQDYPRAFDHYANAAAFASTASHEEYFATIAHIDSLLTELMATARSTVAVAFANMLVGYEAQGGLGGPDPAFSAHYQQAMRQAETQAKDDLARRGVLLN